MKKSIVGKKYIPNDSSYLKNITNPKIDCRLAGTVMGYDPKECEIVSEPYQDSIESCTGHLIHMFVNVSYDGSVFKVLFNERNIEANLEERIKRNKEIARTYGY
tara:strand:+ start:1551 stop:1862 length:312 start_codon:yes stop_codon:yes gene_type:complete